MRAVFAFGILVGFFCSKAHSQSLVGTWQLVSETSCLENDIVGDEEEADLVADLKSRSSGTQSIIEFKDNNTGSESLHIMNKKKVSGTSHFLYRYNDGTLYLLDKKSHLLIGSYDVEKITSDSLIFSNASRSCEIRILIKVKDPK